MAPDDLTRRILAQLQSEERPPLFYETGGMPRERYPDLHERQIEEYNRRWAGRRQRRVEGHAERVREHLARHSRKHPPGRATNGRRQRVWCVELRRPFASLCAAARLVGRAPTNVLQAVRTGVRCGGFHWERYDPARHGTGAFDPCAGPGGGVPPEPASAPDAVAPATAGSRLESGKPPQPPSCSEEMNADSPPEQYDGGVGREGGEEREHRPVPVSLDQPRH